MNEAQFVGPWEMLCERFNRRPSQPVTLFYAQIMRAEGITAEQWQRGVFGVMRFEQFWPSPEQLLEHARDGRSLEMLAIEEFDTCFARMRRGEPATEPGTYTRTLMNSVTNGQPLGNVLLDDMKWVKKEFVERYTAHLKSQAAERTPALTLGAKKELPHASD